MAKRAKAADTFAGGNGDDPAPGNVELFKFRVIGEGVMLMSHKVPKGSVVELTQEEAENHRSHGIPLEDVAADDTQEVFQCRERYEANADD